MVYLVRLLEQRRDPGDGGRWEWGNGWTRGAGVYTRRDGMGALWINFKVGNNNLWDQEKMAAHILDATL